jgi:hypothetical protein
VAAQIEIRDEAAGRPDVRDVESSRFDIGTTSIKLMRVGNVLQILFGSPLEAEYLTGLAQRHNGPRRD